VRHWDWLLRHEVVGLERRRMLGGGAIREDDEEASEEDLEAPIGAQQSRFEHVADEAVEEINRSGTICFKLLRALRLEQCMERPVKVPKQGESLETIFLQVPVSRDFLRQQRKNGAASRKNNSVRTSKYTPWTFFPLAGGYQFRRFVNFFFLVIVVLLIIGNANPNLFLVPWQATGTATYLFILVFAGMLVEGLDDLARHKGDKEENNRPIKRVSFKDGNLIDTTWGKLLPGDLVVIQERQTFPADVILLYGTSTEKKSTCYIETSGIDGETNLKIKEVPQALNHCILESLDESCLATRERELHEVAKRLSVLAKGSYEYEQPNSFLQFDGSFRANNSLCKRAPVSLDFKNLILRGSELRNTKWVIGLVAYAGHETKLALSRQASPVKFSRVDRLVNRLMVVLLVLYFAIVAIADVMLFQESDTSSLWYFKFTSSTETYQLPGGFAFWITFSILFSNLIPISMVFLIEIINKHSQRVIDHDIEMYHEETDTAAKCRTASLSAEIGQITHFFSDKTGTLTRNEMKLVSIFTNNKAYGFQPPDHNEAGESATLKGNPISEDVRENFADVLNLLASENPEFIEEKRKLIDFLVFLAACHTVVLDKDPETGLVTLNSESPDEEAFVHGAMCLGVHLVQASDGIVRIALPDGKHVEYKLLAVNPFSSARKRMSAIFQREDESLVIMMKGADNKMLERVAPGQEDELEKLSEQLLRYAWAGLRTLVMGTRDLEEEEFLSWEKVHSDAMVAPSAVRKEALAKAAAEIENIMTIIGATAIEDQLQAGVPDAIQTLRDAGIQVWVLTGDKVETAINIGLSSRLLDSSMYQMKLISKDAESVRSNLKIMHDVLIPGDESESTSSPSSSAGAGGDMEMGAVTTRNENEDTATSLLKQPITLLSADDVRRAGALALIISGDSLQYLLKKEKGSPELESQLLQVARRCKVVLACRVSPKQKSLVVELVRFAPDSTELKQEPVTLAIGDGANDVPMIQTAHVGVGISGHEGRQAVNSSDFSIAQFRFVVKLVLVHGRWNYRRQATVITFLIYNWIVYILVLYVFQPYTRWSGQQVYYEYLYTFFAAFLFNFAIIAHGWFNKDLSAETVLENPWVYVVGAQNYDLNYIKLLIHVARAGIHVVIIWGIVLSTMPELIGQATQGSTLFTTVFSIFFVRQLVLGQTFTNVTTAAFGFLLVCFIVGMGLVTTPPFIYTPVALAGLAWTQIFLAVTITIVLDIALEAVRLWFFASPLRILQERDRGYLRGVKSKPRSIEDGKRVIKETGKLLISPFPMAAQAFPRRRKRNLQEKGIVEQRLEPPGFTFDSVEVEVGEDSDSSSEKVSTSGAAAAAAGTQQTDSLEESESSHRTLSEIAEHSSRMKFKKFTSKREIS